MSIYTAPRSVPTGTSMSYLAHNPKWSLESEFEPDDEWIVNQGLEFEPSFHALIVEATQRLENNIQELLPMLVPERDSPEWVAEKQRMVNDYHAEIENIKMAQAMSADSSSLTPYYSTSAMSASTYLPPFSASTSGRPESFRHPPAVPASEWNTLGPGTLPTQPQPLYPSFLHQQTSQTWKQATASPIPTASHPSSLNTKNPQSNPKTVSTHSGGRGVDPWTGEVFSEEPEDDFNKFGPTRPLRLDAPVTKKESGPPRALQPRPHPGTKESHGSLVPPVERLVTQRLASTIDSLLASWKLRQDLLLMPPDQILQAKDQIKQAEAEIVAAFTNFLDCDSEGVSSAANGLERNHSQTFIDIIHEVLNWGTLPDAALRRKARRLLQKVTKAREQLPSSLFIEGVSDHDQDPSFHGGFGDVFQALYQDRVVALKRIRIFTADHATSERHRLALYKEALIWQGLHHEFILPLLGIDCSTFAPAFTMVSPWMKNGTVLKYLKERGPRDLDRLLLEIAQGLAYLHSVDVIHGDLRGTNILISDEEHACLSDFGLATIIPDSLATNTSSSNHAGSVRWFAPELFEPERFGCQRTVRTTATDVYAYAVVCVELYTGTPPFSQLSDGAVLFQIMQGMRPQRPQSMSTALFELVTSAWAADFRTRPTSRELVTSLRGLAAVSSLST